MNPATIKYLFDSGCWLIPLRTSGDTKAPVEGFSWTQYPATEDTPWTSNWGLRPFASGLVVIDIDYGDPTELRRWLKANDVAHVAERTRRRKDGAYGWHIWLRDGLDGSDIKLDGKFVSTALRISGDILHYDYAKIWDSDVVAEAIELPIGENMDVGMWEGLGLETAYNRFYVTSPAIPHSHSDSEALPLNVPQDRWWVDRDNYYEGNRSIALNRDTWATEMLGYDGSLAKRFALDSGLSEQKIAYDQACTRRAARQNWFYRVRTGDFDTRDLAPMQARIYRALAYHGDFITGEVCYPSQQTIADIAGCSRKHVNATLQKLEADGWIEHTGYKQTGKRPIKVFTINLDKLTDERIDNDRANQEKASEHHERTSRDDSRCSSRLDALANTIMGGLSTSPVATDGVCRCKGVGYDDKDERPSERHNHREAVSAVNQAQVGYDP